MAGQATSAKAPNHGSNIFIRITNNISSMCGVVAATMIVSAVAITCQMIFVRFVLNQSTIWQTEAVIYLMVGATLIGLPYVQRHRGHVNVDLIPLMLNQRIRRALAILVLIASIIVVSIMAFYGSEQWYEAFHKGWKSDTVWGVRLAIPYIALPIGFGLFLLQLIADLVGVIFRHNLPFDLEEKQ